MSRVKNNKVVGVSPQPDTTPKGVNVPIEEEEMSIPLRNLIFFEQTLITGYLSVHHVERAEDLRSQNSYTKKQITRACLFTGALNAAREVSTLINLWSDLTDKEQELVIWMLTEESGVCTRSDIWYKDHDSSKEFLEPYIKDGVDIFDPLLLEPEKSRKSKKK